MTTKPVNWHTVRSTILNWLDSTTHSRNYLAQQAGWDKGNLSKFLAGKKHTFKFEIALRIFVIISPTLSDAEKMAYLNEIDAQVIMDVLRAMPPELLEAGQPLSLISQQEVGMWHMVRARELVSISWPQALTHYRQAERSFLPVNPLGAKAAFAVAQQHVNLGAYQAAQAELKRLEQTYTYIDPETQCDIYRLRGWIAYYQGQYKEAEQWLNGTIRIAQETGIEDLARHQFIGRIYGIYGLRERSKKVAERYLQKAKKHFLRAAEIEHQCDKYWGEGLSLLGLAKIERLAADWQDATKFRTRAKNLLRQDHLPGQFQLEIACIELENGEVDRAVLLAEQALESWTFFGYPKGISEALTILGRVQMMEGNTEEAFQTLLAGYIIHPMPNHFDTALLSDDVWHLRSDLFRSTSAKDFRKTLEAVQNNIVERKGYFGKLNAITPDRSKIIETVLQQLQPAHV